MSVGRDGPIRIRIRVRGTYARTEYIHTEDIHIYVHEVDRTEEVHTEVDICRL